MDYKLFDFFSSLQDPRRGQGQRHSLENVLTIVIMAILSGHQGLRGFARFAANNAAELTEVLQLKHGVPCYQTFHAVLTGLNESILCKKFIAWMQPYHQALVDSFIAMDGKTVTSSGSGVNTVMQNFVSVVNAFGHQSNMVYGMKAFENGKTGEVQALRDLVEELGLVDKVITMDALHAKKNT
jgi:hypothetical protein